MFCPHDVSLIQFTIFVSVHPDIPTGYEPGLNALPIRKRADIRTRRTCRFSLVYSLLRLIPAHKFLSLNI
jgi:hypothetical protein